MNHLNYQVTLFRDDQQLSKHYSSKYVSRGFSMPPYIIIPKFLSSSETNQQNGSYFSGKMLTVTFLIP